jgi:tetratricopeptide (TPR) repeat protein
MEVNEKNLVLTRAQSAVLSRDFVTAARLYKQLLKTDPSNVDYLRELGSIYVKNGEDSKAIPYYEQIITFYPHYVDAMNSLGAIYRRLKRYEDSIEILQRALEEDRQTGSVNYNLGFTYKEMGNYDDAIEAFEIVIAENPSDVLAYNHLGKIYFERKEYQKSINSYKRGLGVDKNHPILNYNLALCYDEAKMYPEAIRCFETALKSKPGWLDAIKDFSSLLIRCQQTKEAADIVRHSIELHPNDVKLLCLLGEIYLADYDYDSATKTFKRAKSIDANDIKVLSGLAESLEKDEKALDALEPISKAIEVSPDDLNLKKQYAYILLSAKEYDAALYNINELKEEAGENDLQVLDLYEQYYTCIGDEQKAQEYSDKIVKINKHYKNHILTAAKRYSQIGNQQKAETKAKEFIAREIRNPEGYNLLGKIYEDAGDLQSAIDTYNKSISIKIPNVHASRQLAKLNATIEVPPVIENVLPEEMEAVTEAEETQEVAESEIPEEVAEEAVEEEEFDFEQMGGNIPMEEALVEEENPFFEDMENLDKEIEAQNEEIVDNSSGPSADDFYSSAAGEGYAQNDMSGNGAAQNGMSQYPSYSEAEAQMQRNIQDAVMKSSNYAMEAAMTAQKMAAEIAAEQATIKDKLKSIEEQRPYMPVAQESFTPNPIATEPEPAFEEVTDTVADEEPFETIDDLSNDLLGESLSEDETNALLGAPDQLYDENREPLSDASGLLPTIEKIISDDDLASENAEKVDLFKKLLSMSEYLPADEKEDFLSGKPRMQMEYLVAKLSGRPGLLKTAKSLIKSGVLGEEYSLPEEISLSENHVYDNGISNNLIRSVIKTMERLSINLDDKYLSRALCVFADNVLEQIEIQESKVRIF